MVSLAVIEVIGSGVMKSSARTRLCGLRFGMLEFVSWACWQPANANEPRQIDASAHRAALPLISLRFTRRRSMSFAVCAVARGGECAWAMYSRGMTVAVRYSSPMVNGSRRRGDLLLKWPSEGRCRVTVSRLRVGERMEGQ